MITCTFAGHREVYQSGIRAQLDDEIDTLLQKDDDFLFLTGGMGQFDGMGGSAVSAAKVRHPEKRITLTLVLPYLINRLNTEKEYYERNYDEIIVPEELDTTYYKAAIQRRNRWMVDRADIVIAYVYRDFGGACSTVKYAKRQGKPVINLAKKK